MSSGTLSLGIVQGSERVRGLKWYFHIIID